MDITEKLNRVECFFSVTLICAMTTSSHLLGSVPDWSCELTIAYEGPQIIFLCSLRIEIRLYALRPYIGLT